MKDKLNIVYLYGGLGNQLFQINFACLHSDYNQRIVIDTSYISENSKMILEKISKYYREAPKQSRAGSFRKNFFRAVSKIDKFVINDRNFYGMNNTGHYFGYWQSEEFSIGFSKLIGIDHDFLKNERKYAGKDYFAVHCRQGDYLSSKNKKIYNVLGFDYYRSALENLRKDFPKVTTVKLISHEKPPQELYDICVDLGLAVSHELSGTYSDFLAMLKAKRLVCANSTFSFWAGLLSQKEFYRPRIWFKDPNIEFLPNYGKLL
jgi:hypothetical protein